MTQVGVTHDVVIYDSAGNIPPVGLITKPFSYRVSEAPTFIPRMAVGDPRGTDYASFTSLVQRDWRGASQVKRGDSHAYWRMCGIAPDRRTGDLVNLQFADAVIPTNIYNHSTNVAVKLNRIPTVAGVHTVCWSAFATGSRIFLDAYCLMPFKTFNRMSDVKEMGVLPYSFCAYDAVQFSGVAFISTYAWSAPSGSSQWFDWKDIYAHVDNTVYSPMSTTTGQALAVYDNRLWRSEPSGHRIAYYEIREPPTVHDTNQGALSYLGDGGNAEFRDSGQDFSEWGTTEGDAAYKLVVTNSDSSECWGYMGAANNTNLDIDIYREKNLSTRGWLGSTTTPYGDGKTASAYEIRDAVPPEEEVTAWSDWTALDPSSRIRNMEPFIGRLFVGCTDSLWAYEAGRTYKVVDFHHLDNDRNFKMMQSGHGALWFNLGKSLYRYTAGGLLEELDFVPKIDGYLERQYPSDIATGPGCMYVMTSGPGAYNGGFMPTAWRLDVETGASQELLNLSALARAGVAFDASPLFAAKDYVINELSAANTSELVIGPIYTTFHQTKMHFMSLGQIWDLLGDGECEGRPDTTNPDQYFMESVWLDLGYEALYKNWQRIHVTGYLVAIWDDTQEFYVQYRTDEGDSWHTLGVVLPSDIGNGGTKTLDFPGIVSSKQIQLRIQFKLSGVPLGAFQPRMRLTRLEIDGLLQGPGQDGRIRRQISFGAIVTDDLELLNMTVENSAAHIVASLYSFAQSGIPHIVALPFPPPVGHTTEVRVQLGQVGAAVPILPTSYSQIPSGCPAADFNIVLTEV